MNVKDTRLPATDLLKRWSSHATEATALFPAIALVGLLTLWGMTYNLIKVEHAAADQSARTTSAQLVETYEAQVVRALREIDQSMKFVKYAYEHDAGHRVLTDLKARDLLPPDLLFGIAIADAHGDVVENTRTGATLSVADQDIFKEQQSQGTFAVAKPRRGDGAESWEQQFSRRLDDPDGGFSGVVIVSVDAAYFVSGYDVARFGEHGALGVLGTDGVLRAWRSGEAISAGKQLDFASVVSSNQEDDTPVAILATDAVDGVLRYASAQRLFDFPLTVLIGLSADEQLAASRASARTYLWRAAIVSLLMAFAAGMLSRMNRRIALGRVRAIEEEIAHAARVEYLAYHDGLTTLPNRSLFSKLLGQSINQARRSQWQLAVLFLDLDRFKNINDTLGHEAGDELLREVAVRLKGCLRDSDTVARLGGDEFVALLPKVDLESDVSVVAQKILKAIARPFKLAGKDFHVTASVGISVYPQDGLDEQSLTKSADIAMYKAKEDGKNNFQFYSEKMNAHSIERLAMEADLRDALESDGFELHYRPRRDMADGKISGVEALLQWRHPDLGDVSSSRFVPIAEETGLIVPIGKWMLRAACVQCVDWQRAGLEATGITVPLTLRQFFDERLPDDLAIILADTGMEARMLELEFTESFIMRDVAKALDILGRLKQLGLRIAISDFGVGYGSLSGMKRFPLDTIKISRAFLESADSAGATAAGVAEPLIAIGRALSLTVVALGVEAQADADALQRGVCGTLRSAYLQAPVSANAIAVLLREQHTRS